MLMVIASDQSGESARTWPVLSQLSHDSWRSVGEKNVVYWTGKVVAILWLYIGYRVCQLLGV